MTEPEPLLRVVRGEPTGEEAAALAVVLAAKLAARPAQARKKRAATGGWADRARAMRAPLTPGPGAWRNAARPG
ncbi:MAG TPA: acyl-CoA carboxylase subunit epsilon [Streptosporangiaceae bacterium]|nr:acyl-CoA carboxylase subunit epsilon [Streptosporangiaceae bacterium]